MSPQSRTSPTVQWCSECQDRLEPGEPIYVLGQRVICMVCWDSPVVGHW